MTSTTNSYGLLKHLGCIFGGAAFIAAAGITALHYAQSEPDTTPTDPGANVAQNIAHTVNTLPQSAADRMATREQWAREYNALSAACQGLQTQISGLFTAKGIDGNFTATHDIAKIDVNDKKYGECTLRYNDKYVTIFDQAISLESDWFRDHIGKRLTEKMPMDELKKLSAPVLSPR